MNNETDVVTLVEGLEKAIHDFPMFVTPCKYCAFYKKLTRVDLETCTHCSYYYPSQFKYNPQHKE